MIVSITFCSFFLSIPPKSQSCPILLYELVQDFDQRSSLYLIHQRNDQYLARCRLTSNCKTVGCFHQSQKIKINSPMALPHIQHQPTSTQTHILINHLNSQRRRLGHPSSRIQKILHRSRRHRHPNSAQAHQLPPPFLRGNLHPRQRLRTRPRDLTPHLDVRP